MTDIDLSAFQSWFDQRLTVEETLSPMPAAALAATLDLHEAMQPTATLPPLWHWIHFFDRSPSATLAVDGSPRSRALLPPVPLPEVMWAGADVQCLRPLRLGASARRVSRLAEMTRKDGARGPMVFITHEHRIEQDGEVAVIENNRAVYLGAATPGKAKAAGPDMPAPAHERRWRINEAVLFRYSALTFNSHRIHYDLRYATEVARYPGLVVHGPLQATLLAESFRQWMPGARLKRIDFRAMAPLFCGEDVRVRAILLGPGQAQLWTRTEGTACGMRATVDYEPR